MMAPVLLTLTINMILFMIEFSRVEFTHRYRVEEQTILESLALTATFLASLISFLPGPSRVNSP